VRLALRRTLHLASGVIAFLGLLSGGVLRATTLALALAALALEWLRLHHAGFRQWVGRLLPVFREREELRPSGAMWLAIGYAMASWVPMPAPSAGILAAALGDPAASWVGSRWGSGPRKSWIGTLAMMLAAGLAVACTVRCCGARW